MYFWNIHALAGELRLGSLTEKQKMMYFLVYLCNYFLGGAFSETPTLATKIFAFVFAVAVQTIAAVVCYQANSRGDGKNFLERYICLQVPLIIRFWAFSILAFFVLGFSVIILNMPEPVLTITAFMLFLGSLGAYIAYLRSFVARVAAEPADTDLPAGPPASS